jgi:hypothetical protein
MFPPVCTSSSQHVAVDGNDAGAPAATSRLDAVGVVQQQRNRRVDGGRRRTDLNVVAAVSPGTIAIKLCR